MVFLAASNLIYPF